MERVGERLRRRREELGLTLRDVSEATKFRPETIEAVEEGRTSVFPAEAYLNAFLRAYAKVLGLDPEEVVQGQKSEIERAREAIAQIKIKPRRRKRSRTRLVVIGASVLAVVLVTIVWITPRRTSYQSAEEALVTKPVEGAVAESLSVQKQTPISERPQVEARTGDTLVVVAKRTAWLKLSSAGSTLFYDYLRGGDSLEFVSSEDFTIDILSDREAIRFSLNGRPVMIPRSQDQLSNFVIPVKENP